jgi:glucarate dehydratase
MAPRAAAIAHVHVTPVAVPDPPLLNAAGCHEPLALRTIVEVEDGAGRVGLGEAYGDDATVAALQAAGRAIVGVDPWALAAIAAAVHDPQVHQAAACSRAAAPALNAPGATRSRARHAYAAIEMACLDLQGQQAQVPVAELLGGRRRDEVPFAAYLFYKFARHAPRDGGSAPPEADAWGEVLTPEAVVREAQAFSREHGFTTFKLKGGVFPPDDEFAAVAALRQTLGPEAPLRWDPNAAWTVETAVRMGERLREIGLEYYEDPCPGMEGMAEVRRRTGLPTATNMCVTSFDQLPDCVRLRPVDYLLTDPHFWGGLRETVRLSAFCQDFGIGVSMHSNTHLGVSLAAMVHVAAAMPHLSAACDTHYPWQRGQDLLRVPWTFRRGCLRVPEAPGLGVTLDRQALARMHAAYLVSGMHGRDDGAEMRRHVPGWDDRRPRW